MVNLDQTNGIVFKVIKYSESSLILDIFTKNHGLKSYIISGVRNARSKQKANLFQLLNILTFTAYHGHVEKLVRIKEANYYYKYQELGIEIIKTLVATFLLEVSRNTIREKEENLPLYQFIESSLIKLDKLEKNQINTFYLNYLIELSSYAGFAPMNNYNKSENEFDLQNGKFVAESTISNYILSKEASEQLHLLLDKKMNFTCTKVQRNDLVDNLLLYYSLHVESFKKIKSIEVLRDIF